MSILERLPEHEIISAVLEAGKLLDGAGAVHEVHAKNRTDFVTMWTCASRRRSGPGSQSCCPRCSLWAKNRTTLP